MKLHFEPGALRPVGTREIAESRQRAAESPRERGIVRYHDHSESLQRMLHAIEPASYVRPHKHEQPDKLEGFLALRGAARVCRFDEVGELVQHLEIRAGGPCFGVEIPARSWHSLVALEPGTVLYEWIEGAFDPATHKHYAAWAPEEGSPEAEAFLHELRQRTSDR